MSLETNHRYILDLLNRLRNEPSQEAVLDYGCGAGTVVDALLEQGMDAHGVEAFYEGGNTYEAVRATGYYGTRIHRLADGVIPYPDGRFDVVISNQVFEHIEDLTLPILEIRRVLKHDGALILLFPSREVWREGHIGIPFAHRFAKGDGGLRHGYALTLRRLGLGYNKGDKSPTQWTRDALSWIDQWTFYRPLDEIHRLIEPHFKVRDFGGDYLAYRLRQHPVFRWTAPLAAWAPFRPALGAATFYLAGLVWVLEPR